MSLARPVLVVVLGLMLGAAACRHETAEPRGGRLSVRLTGRDQSIDFLENIVEVL